MAAARRGEDRVERRFVGPAPGAVALDDLDIVVAEPLQPLARDLDQLVLALDGDHLAGDAADHRGRVARARADLEHLVAGPIPAAWIISADDIRLRDGLPGLDRQRMVAIGEMRIFGADERLARHREEGVEDVLLVDPAALQLPLDHRLALGGEVCHGFGHRAHRTWE